MIRGSLKLIKISSKFTELALGYVLYKLLVTEVLPGEKTSTKSNNTQKVLWDNNIVY